MNKYSLDLKWNASSDLHYVWRLANGSIMEALDEEGNPTRAFMDPEEAFIASIASCHLLSFVAEAARSGYSVESYHDHPVAALDKNRQSRLYVARMLMQPRATFSGSQPSDEEIEHFHSKAREKCFISNSVLTDVKVEPQL